MVWKMLRRTSSCLFHQLGLRSNEGVVLRDETMRERRLDDINRWRTKCLSAESPSYC